MTGEQLSDLLDMISENDELQAVAKRSNDRLGVALEALEALTTGSIGTASPREFAARALDAIVACDDGKPYLAASCKTCHRAMRIRDVECGRCAGSETITGYTKLEAGLAGRIGEIGEQHRKITIAARDLRDERDAARRDAEHWRGEAEILAEWKAQALEARRERDELRRQLGNLRAAYEQVEGDDARVRSERTGLQNEVNELREHIGALEAKLIEQRSVIANHDLNGFDGVGAQRLAWLHEFANERERQVEKWGEGPMPADTTLAILVEEVGEVGKALNERMPDPDVKAELVQVAAVALRWLEHFEESKLPHRAHDRLAAALTALNAVRDGCAAECASFGDDEICPGCEPDAYISAVLESIGGM